jgi:hypothetical protein
MGRLCFFVAKCVRRCSASALSVFRAFLPWCDVLAATMALHVGGSVRSVGSWGPLEERERFCY